MSNDIILEGKIPNKFLTNKVVVCPTCGSNKINEISHSQTCVGSLGGIDPNHHYRVYSCPNCPDFYVDSKQFYDGTTNYWIFGKNRVVIAGISSCCTGYKYPCFCGGIISSKIVNKDGSDSNGGVSYSIDSEGRWTSQQKKIYTCDICDFKLETKP